MGQARPSRFPPAGCWPKIADGEHVGIGPVSWLGILRPLRNARKLVSKALRIVHRTMPEIPDIVRDTPHLRVFPHFGNLVEGRRSRRQAENNRTASLAQRGTQHANVIRLIGTATDAVCLDQIYVPPRVEPGD